MGKYMNPYNPPALDMLPACVLLFSVFRNFERDVDTGGMRWLAARGSINACRSLIVKTGELELA